MSDYDESDAYNAEDAASFEDWREEQNELDSIGVARTRRHYVVLEDDGTTLVVYTDEDDDPVVEIGDWKEGETLAERNARLLAQNDAAAQAARPEGTESNPTIGLPTRAPRMKARGLGDDENAIRDFFELAARSVGFSFAELVRPARPGPPRAADRGRRDALAVIVARAREGGGKFEAIARVAGRSLATAAQLAADGRAAIDREA